MDGRRCLMAVALSVLMACAATMRPEASSQTPRQLPAGRADGREFVVRITPALPMSACHVHSLRTGPFGGHVDSNVNDRGGGAFAIRTGVDGQPAATLKIALWCRGYATATLNIASLSSSTFETAVSLAPLPGLPMTGRVLPSLDGASKTGATLRVFYTASWLCAFFGLIDCGVPQWEIAVDRIRDDGTFRVLVPDFAHDPAVQPQPPGLPHIPDGFRLRVDREVAPYNYWLGPDGAPPLAMIPVAAAYPELALRPGQLIGVE